MRLSKDPATRKGPSTGRMASGGALAPELRRATRSTTKFTLIQIENEYDTQEFSFITKNPAQGAGWDTSERLTPNT